jgi:hypothetical protein
VPKFLLLAVYTRTGCECLCARVIVCLQVEFDDALTFSIEEMQKVQNG